MSEKISENDRNTIVIKRHVETGLGDRMLDLCGASVLAHYFSRKYGGHVIKSVIETSKGECQWGEYSSNDIDFMHGRISAKDDTCAETYTISCQPGCSMHPLKISRFLRNLNGFENIHLEDISSKFCEFARMINPGKRVEDCLPDLNGAIGIHLRRSDKITDDKNFFHGTDQRDFQLIIDRMKDYLKLKLIAGHRKFYVCSEDLAWKSEIENFMRHRCPDVILLTPNFSCCVDEADNLSAMVDFFALSRCCVIIQGIAYSTFSMMASLINNAILINFSEKARTKPAFFFNWWKPLLVFSKGDENHTCEQRFRFEACAVPDPYIADIHLCDLDNFLDLLQSSRPITNDHHTQSVSDCAL